MWNVLQALQEQDDVLADIIRQMQEDKGKGGEQKGDDFGEIIETIGVDISLNTLQEVITAVCIDKLGFTWDMRYGELIKYKEQFGDFNIPREWTENKPLARWVTKQRSRKETLSGDHIKRLENHLHCNIPNDCEENKQLAKWVDKQRVDYYKQKT